MIFMNYHLRRADKQINEKVTLNKILEETKYITIAMSVGDEPYLVSLSHSYDADHGCIYFHSATEGKKLEIMRKNPRVWGQALLDHGYHEGECSHLYASVMFKGHIEWVTEYEEKRKVFLAMARRLDADPEKLIPTLKSLQTPDGLKSTIMGKIIIEEMTGKKSAEITV
jgi:nitroimidazol reductase NimA-like FMN-containing flavoprotein (pyridoxamine 5'-phosphate oxidase superfamily)